MRKIKRVPLRQFRGLDVEVKLPIGGAGQPWMVYYTGGGHIPLMIYLYPATKDNPAHLISQMNSARPWDEKQCDTLACIYEACAEWLRDQEDWDPE